MADLVHRIPLSFWILFLSAYHIICSSAMEEYAAAVKPHDMCRNDDMPGYRITDF